MFVVGGIYAYGGYYLGDYYIILQIYLIHLAKIKQTNIFLNQRGMLDLKNHIECFSLDQINIYSIVTR